MTTVAQTFRPSMPIEIVDDEDVVLLLHRENVDLIVCISVEKINHVCPERNHKQPEPSHNPHHTTSEYEFHHTHQSNIQVCNMDGFQRSDVQGANLDDIREGFTPTPNIDTTSPSLIPNRDETEPNFNPIPNQTLNQYDKQFAHVQRLVPPPCASYVINSGEVAPRPVTMRIEVGEVFPSKKQLQLQLGSYCLANRFQIRVFKSDTTRYQVRCIVEDCSWKMRAARIQNSNYFQIRKFDNHHMINRSTISTSEARHRARHIALEEIQGTPAESYSILPSYLYMLEQTNPRTITDFHTDSSNRFMYMFFCFKACIDGFLSSIRPVIAIDGTFLTGPHRGVLFMAVCMDDNEPIFPLAFDVGESETNEGWEWFLSRLHKAVGEVEDLVIVSDRKNSIITSVEKVFPNSFYDACAIHLQRNMLAHYGKNKTLKLYFERATRVYRESQFLQLMEQLANINSEAAQYVTAVKFDSWSQVYNPRKRYNIMSTNIAESMNNALRGCKELPITGVIDYTRGVLQGWFYERRTYALKLTTQLQPQIVFLVAAYNGKIHPVGQPSEWLVPLDIASKIARPPVGRRPPGRPRMNRIPSFGEEVTQRRCTTCHRVGHNSHTCAYPKSSTPSNGIGSTSEIGEASGSYNVI
ncbi:hypothetical protein Ddye_029642 [Dipteronia dyeriana]|uniref:Transposase n=1 Tax=Dipteronia dyeriana TaxID=168575 RepID=A0AAD9TEU0_9ROSI|nr:hypothetical protein Ddye_029642 [Dipteronia dyeriana]